MDFLLIILTIIIGVLTFLLLKKERVLGINTDDSKNKDKFKIIEAQVGSILSETDIVRYQDIYGRVKN
jgi:hypothetical protein